MPPFLGVALVTPLRPGPLVAAPAIPSQPRPIADAPAKPAAAAAPPASSVRRSNFETIGPPFPRTQRTPRRFAGDVSAQDPLRGGGTVEWRAARLGSPRLRRLAGRALGGHPQGLRERRRRLRRVDVPQRRRGPGRRRPPPPAPLPGLAGDEEAGPRHHRPQGGCAALLLLLAGAAGSPRLRPGPLPARARRAAVACPACSRGARSTSLLDVAAETRRGPPRPRRARAPLRGRAARLGAVRARPGRHRPARPHRDRARQGRQAAAGAGPRRRRRRAAGVVRATGGTRWTGRPRPPS